MRIRRLVVVAAMGALGLVAARKLKQRSETAEEFDAWDAPPPPATDQTPPAQPFAAPSDPAGQPATDAGAEGAIAAPSGKVKGNVRADGEKIYHMPGDAMYERTKAEQEFDTPEDAEAAGFRRVGSPRKDATGEA